MGTRVPSYQLNNGLRVSGRPEDLKERQPSMSSRSVPYTGGDVSKSGELGKMFDILAMDRINSMPRRLSSASQPIGGSARFGPNYGHLVAKTYSMSRTWTSGPMVPLQPTGLIVSGPQGSSVAGLSGRFEPATNSIGKTVYGSAVTSLSEEAITGFLHSRIVMWVLTVVVVLSVLVGASFTVAEGKVLVLVAAVVILAAFVLVLLWNCGWKNRGLLGYFNRFPDTELRGAINGQFVKVTGVVTCGSIPFESSYQKQRRCIYVSAELNEYRGWGAKSANPKHRYFSWARRYSENYVADFYISDFQSGLRALVKAGYGSKVSVFVRPTTTVDMTKETQQSSPAFMGWLSDRSLSSDDRVMRLTEGYIKEGSTVSVMGVVRRQDNILMIVPPPDPISTSCQWLRCLFPTYAEGLVVTCEESQNTDDVIPV